MLIRTYRESCCSNRFQQCTWRGSGRAERDSRLQDPFCASIVCCGCKKAGTNGSCNKNGYKKQLPASQTTAAYTVHQVQDFIQCSTTSKGKDMPGMNSNIMVPSLGNERRLYRRDQKDVCNISKTESNASKGSHIPGTALPEVLLRRLLQVFISLDHYTAQGRPSRLSCCRLCAAALRPSSVSSDCERRSPR